MASPGDVIGSAFVEIRPEVSAFENALQQGLSGPMQRTGSMMGKIFTGAAVGLGGIATAAFAAINHTVDLGQAAYEMGEKFGLSGKQASTFIAVGKLVGVSSDQMGIGMRTLSKQLNTTSIDLKNHASAATLNKLPLQELGIASTDASGHLRDMAPVLSDIADKFAAMPDGPQKAALATQLFGRAGTDLIPILDQGSKGIAELTAQATAEGAVLSGPQVDAAHKAYLAHKQLDAAISGAAMTIGTALMPYLTQAADWLSKNLPGAISVLSRWINTVALPDLIKFGKWVGDNIIGPLVSIGQVVIPPLLTALGSIVGWASKQGPILLGIGAIIAGWWAVDKISNWVSTASGAISKVLGTFGGASGGVGSGKGGVLSMVGVQKVFVVNMPGGGIPGLGGPAAVPAAAGGTALIGEGGLLGTSIAGVLGLMGATLGAAALGAAAIYGAGIGLTYLTGHQNDIGGPLGGLADPVAKMIGDLNVSSDATSALRGSLQTSSPQFVLALSRMTQSQTFSSLAADRQKLLLEDLASAMQSGLVKTPQDVQNFADSFSQAQKAALGLPPDVKAVNTVFSQNKQRFANDIGAIVTSLNTSVDVVKPLPKNLQDLVNAVTPTKPTSLQGALDNIGKVMSDPKFAGPMEEVRNAFSHSVLPAQTVSDRLHDLQTHVTDANQATSLLQGHFASGASNGAQIPQSVTDLHLAVGGTSIQSGVLGSRFTGAISSVGNLPSAAGGLLSNVNTAAGAAWRLAGGLRGALNAVGSIIADVKSGLPHSATGNTFPLGGLSWVGEQGPELAYIPAGGRIIPHGDSLSIAAGMRSGNGGGMTVHQTFNINGGDRAQVQAIIHQEFRSLELSLRAQ